MSIKYLALLHDVADRRAEPPAPVARQVYRYTVQLFLFLTLHHSNTHNMPECDMFALDSSAIASRSQENFHEDFQGRRVQPGCRAYHVYRRLLSKRLSLRLPVGVARIKFDKIISAESISLARPPRTGGRKRIT